MMTNAHISGEKYGIPKQKDANTWKLVMAYECPTCGKLVRDKMAACNHICESKEAYEEEGW